MINEYTEEIGNALYQFAKAHFDAEFVSYDKSWYQDFAHLGLQKTITWTKELSQYEKDEINSGMSQIYYYYNPKSTVDCQ